VMKVNTAWMQGKRAHTRSDSLLLPRTQYLLQAIEDNRELSKLSDQEIKDLLIACRNGKVSNHVLW
jgi:hypothetical protein